LLVVGRDGDDTCAGTGDADNDAQTAARAAEALYKPVLAGNGGVNSDGSLKTTTDPASSVTTFLISFGAGADLTRANWIAWGGSGLGEGWTSPAINWTTSSTAALQTARDNCVTCEDALTASTASELKAAIQGAIDRGSSIGEFSSQSQGSVTESVFEFAGKVGIDPLNGAPGTANRYATSYDLTVRSTFLMPNFEGQVRFTIPPGRWCGMRARKRDERAQRVGVIPGAAQLTEARASRRPSFRWPPDRRRIFFTPRNGYSMGNIPLWPPTTNDRRARTLRIRPSCSSARASPSVA
jgi:hypothetical protein